MLLGVEHGHRTIDAGTLPVISGEIGELDGDVERRSRFRRDVTEVEAVGAADGLPTAVVAVGALDLVAQIIPNLLGIVVQKGSISVEAGDRDRSSDGDGTSECRARVADRERSVTFASDTGCDVVDDQRRRVAGGPIDEDSERRDTGIHREGLLCGEVGTRDAYPTDDESSTDGDCNDLRLLGGEQV